MTLLLMIAGSLFLVILMLVAKNVIASKLALIRFKKLSKGLPMYPESRLFGNHVLNILVGDDNCEKIQMWHNKLGKTIGWLDGSKFCALTVDLNLIKTFIQDEPDAHLSRGAYILPFGEFQNSIMMARKNEWPRLRRMIGPALAKNKFMTPNVLQEIEQSITKVVDSIDKQIASNRDPDYKFNIDDIMHKFSLDLIFRCFFKQEGQIEFDNPNDPWVKASEQAFESAKTSFLLRLAAVFPIICHLLDWLMWNFLPQGACRQKIMGFVKSQAILGLKARKQLGRMKAEAKKTDAKIDESDFMLKDGTRFKRNMVDYIIDQFLDGKLTKSQYMNSSCFLMAAANRTASDCIGYTIYLLSINQHVQDKLRESIRADGIESEYLDWVLLESLRLRPPAPVGCSRTVERDIEIEGGHVVPAGTFVVTCSYVIHRLKQYWGYDADEFRPERWRDTSHHHPFQYLPFGAGPRGCPGRMFAMHEMKMLFTALLTRYRFEGTPRNDADKFDSPFWIFVIPRSPTRIKIHRL
uniref:Cytochrome P450 3A24 n=1 Tax=Aceria tosichella TaxID=561515 RepID=A0A6G1SQ35_9ACAR